MRVYEQAAELGEVGAGVGLFPNSMRILQRLGVADSVTRRAAPINEWWMLAPGGSVLSHQVAGRDGPGGSLGVYRPDLVAELAAGLPHGVLHTGHRCVAFKSGRPLRGGDFRQRRDRRGRCRDRCRRHPFDTATLRCRALPARVLRRGGLSRGDAGRPGAQLVVATSVGQLGWPWQTLPGLPRARGHTAQLCGICPADEQMRESWSAPGDPAALAAEFADWDPWLSRLLSQIDATFRWGLYDRDPLPRWTHGRLTLLGDAAHAMLPHMGQGANQAIEDGMALATLMRDAGAADVTDVLIRYQALRHDHTARVQQASRTNGMRMDSGRAIIIGQPGVHDYDVEAEARAMR